MNLSLTFTSQSVLSGEDIPKFKGDNAALNSSFLDSEKDEACNKLLIAKHSAISISSRLDTEDKVSTNFVIFSTIVPKSVPDMTSPEAILKELSLNVLLIRCILKACSFFKYTSVLPRLIL